MSILYLNRLINYKIKIKILKKKIDSQRVDNVNKRSVLKAEPQAERHRKKIDLIIKKKQEEINALRKQMEEIAPLLKDALIELLKHNQHLIQLDIQIINYHLTLMKVQQKNIYKILKDLQILLLLKKKLLKIKALLKVLYFQLKFHSKNLKDQINSLMKMDYQNKNHNNNKLLTFLYICNQ